MIRDQGVSIQQALWGCLRRPTTPHEALDHLSYGGQLTQSVLQGSDGRGGFAPQRSRCSPQPAFPFSSRTACSEKASRPAGQASAERERKVVKVAATARATPKAARVQHMTPKERTSSTSSSRSTRTPCGTREQTVTQVSVFDSRGNSARTQRSAAENMCASAALVRVSRTTTVYVSKQSSERPLLLNAVMGVPFPTPVAVNLSSPVRVLLVSETGGHRDEILQGWSDLQSSLNSPLPLELIHYFSLLLMWHNSQILDLPDRIRGGSFQLVCVLPPNATWTRQLRSRRFPFTLEESGS